ncbi:MAG: phosphate ABC transporter ATP-binding protein, partial [Candidatus Hermodarchaeota archaeon]
MSLNLSNNKKKSVVEINKMNKINDSNSNNIVIECRHLNLWYDDNQALKDINLIIKKNKVTAIIGPS